MLLVYPILALLRLAQVWDQRYLFGYAILISLLTYLFYASDKDSARSGDWRTPESILHFAELLGGWPGAFLAQRFIRHKISKTSYQVEFWMIIALYQFASFDYLRDFYYSGKIVLFLLQ